MITKMEKLVLFMPNSEADIDANLTLLGQLGVMHVMPFQPAKDASIERVDARIKQLEKAIGILDNCSKNDNSKIEVPADLNFRDRERGEIALLEKVLEAEAQEMALEKLEEEQAKELRWYKEWGNVSLSEIEDLNRIGVSIRLYLLDDRDFKKIQDCENASLVGKIDQLHQIVFVSQDGNEKLDFKEVDLPKYQRVDLQKLVEKNQLQMEENRNLLQILALQKDVLQIALEERIRRMDVRNVHYAGKNIDEQILCWKGFIPEQSVDELVAVAEKNSWAYIIEEPDQEELDEVPTLVQSAKWAERIRPVMNFMGLVPGYKELDVSKVFMIFFTFFTGILVGDAGYGLIFLLITLAVHSKTKFKRKIEFDLIYTLSAAIMIWGVLTGTYFGSQAIADLPLLSHLRIDKLASFGGDSLFVQQLMFSIGAIQLTIGHLQTAWKYNNSVKAIAQLGWVAIIWGLYFVVDQMVLGIPAPAAMPWLFVGGSVLIALFSNPGTSFFKGVLSSLGSLPLSVISGFSDIISYIRLYAVGLSTVLMATSFNQMALGDGITTVASGISAVLVLVLGHGLNMILAGMAVIVHGVRLNMLEYAGHANVEFSGSEYQPFKLKNQRKL
jgi:V/A-type H+-transporting ATPase subunit I